MNRIARWLLCLIAAATLPLSAATFTVTTTADSGPGSLRQAIADANASAGEDQIHFNIGGGGPQTIAIASALPPLTGTVVIDGTTQPGFAGKPIVTIDGNGVAAGLQLLASGTIRGLVLVRFNAFAILVTGAGGTIAGNYIGVDATGSVAMPNGTGIVVGPENTAGPAIIGSPDPADRNVISGNGAGIGILPAIDGSPSVGNIVEGNFIGLDATGSFAVPNEVVGIVIDGGDGNRIGGTAAGAGNVISGNGGDGVRIESRGNATADFATGNILQGNRIGTNPAGTAAIPNAGNGIALAGARNTTVGGSTAGAVNVISGNGEHGMKLGFVCGPVQCALRTEDTVISGNFIGTDITGSVDLGNGDSGIALSGPQRTTIGEPGAWNVISGNDGAGIEAEGISFTGVSTSTFRANIASNRIGTDVTGSVAIPNSGDGLSLGETSGSVIENNVISGNGGRGIVLFARDSIAPATNDNVVRGNRIGTNASGTAPLPNAGHGIELFAALGAGSVVENTVGGTGPGDANTIRFNGGDGISVRSGFRNQFLGNSIDLNGGLGIDLEADGVLANDPGDSDFGANRRQNHPILTAAVITGAATNVTGTFNSTPASTFRIEFFGSPAADPTGFGEGRTFLAFADVTTDAAGDAPLAVTLPAVAAGTVITATATDRVSLDTSEFSNAVEAALPPALAIGDASAAEGDSGTATLTFTVSLSGPAPTDVTFDFATSDGTATAPGDYTATTGSRSIPAGSSSTTIIVPIAGDTTPEDDETFTVTIANVEGATAGDVSAVGRIVSDDLTAAAGIPTLSEWALLLTALLLGLAATKVIRT